MYSSEPTPQSPASPLARYLLATRPPFLAASPLAAVLGIAAAGYAGAPLAPGAAALAVLVAVLAHAGTNVLNDYYDALSGADARNTDRIHPFTGGSRFVQNGILTPTQLARFGWLLLAAGAGAGLPLLPRGGSGLAAIGLAGVVLGWAYSARGPRLSSRGLGEPVVLAGVGVLIPAGAAWAQAGGPVPEALAAGVPYGLLATALLFVNQFPDRRADAAAGKRNWVVRLKPRRARWLYGVITGAAYAWTAWAAGTGSLPVAALAALVPAVLSGRAWLTLIRWADTPAFLEPAIRRSISALTGYGVVLTAALWWAA